MRADARARGLVRRWRIQPRSEHREHRQLHSWQASVGKVPPLGSAPARFPCLLRGRLAALGSSALRGRGRPTGRPRQPLPRVLDLAASEAAHFPAFDHAGKGFDKSHAKSLGLAIVAQVVGATLATLFTSTVGGDAIDVSVPGADGAGELIKSSVVEQRGQSGPLAVPGLGSCVSSGCAWRLRPARHSDEEASPIGRPATAPGAPASRLRSCRFPRL